MNAETLKARIEGKFGSITKLSGRDNSTLQVETHQRGRLGLLQDKMLYCQAINGEYVRTSEVQSWVEVGDRLRVKTCNSVWEVQIEY